MAAYFRAAENNKYVRPGLRRTLFGTVQIGRLLTRLHHLPGQLTSLRPFRQLAVAVTHVLPGPWRLRWSGERSGRRALCKPYQLPGRRPVATPVWVIAHDGHLYVWTGARTSARSGGSGHNPDVTLAACTARGAVTGPPRRAHAAGLRACRRATRSLEYRPVVADPVEAEQPPGLSPGPGRERSDLQVRHGVAGRDEQLVTHGRDRRERPVRQRPDVHRQHDDLVLLGRHVDAQRAAGSRWARRTRSRRPRAGPGRASPS